jgi:hypothetical protein
LISNNIVAIFYGFVLRVQSVKGEDISEDKRHFVNIYTGLQWVKNCMVIILLPQAEKIFADIIFKILIMKTCVRMCQKKSKRCRKWTGAEEPVLVEGEGESDGEGSGNENAEQDGSEEAEPKGRPPSGVSVRKIDPDGSTGINSDKKSKFHSNTQDTVGKDKSSKNISEEKPYGARAKG